ncbi:MAG: hypothetical protein ACREM3_01285 [Candidatus Rokuibacteriota bacterium]
MAVAEWIDPGTRHIYPMSYPAYRRAREAEEKRPPRHRSFGPDVEYRLSRGWSDRGVPEVEVLLTVRPDTSPRVRRIVSAVLRAIRRGQPADDALRMVARRFGLRHRRALACITACLGFEVRPRQDPIPPGFTGRSSLDSALAEWM